MSKKTFGEKLKEFGLRVYHKEYQPKTDDPDEYTEPIDFSIDDGTDNVAWVWGSEPWHDVEIECNHPEECIEWGDDDECGECLLCGDQCTWRWVEETEYDGTDDNGNIEYSKSGYRDIAEWHHTDSKGIIGEYLKELQKVW